jgi:hypothetical protein
MLILVAHALAQQEAPAPVPRTTEIEFPDVQVEAGRVVPGAVRVAERRAAEFNPLFRLRLEFDAEIAATATEAR